MLGECMLYMLFCMYVTPILKAVSVFCRGRGGHILNEHIWRIREDCLKKKENPSGSGLISVPNPGVDGLWAALFKRFLDSPSSCF